MNFLVWLTIHSELLPCDLISRSHIRKQNNWVTSQWGAEAGQKRKSAKRRRDVLRHRTLLPPLQVWFLSTQPTYPTVSYLYISNPPSPSLYPSSSFLFLLSSFSSFFSSYRFSLCSSTVFKFPRLLCQPPEYRITGMSVMPDLLGSSFPKCIRLHTLLPTQSITEDSLRSHHYCRTLYPPQIPATVTSFLLH